MHSRTATSQHDLRSQVWHFLIGQLSIDLERVVAFEVVAAHCAKSYDHIP